MNFIVRRVQALIAMGALLCVPQAFAAGGKLRGYAGATSVAQGESIDLHVSDLAADPGKPRSYPITFFRKGAKDEFLDADVLTVKNEGLTPGLSEHGARWPVSYSRTIPAAWPSGLYVAHVGDGQDDSRDIYFVVRNARPGSTSSVVVALPWTTANAYSNWGGKSLYVFNSEGGAPPTRTSFDRPLSKDSMWPFGFGVEEEYIARLRAFMVWLEQSNYTVEYVTSVDLHADPELLAHYKAYVSVGHDEYWSSEMRDNVDRFIARGGHVAVFSGNTSYWRIRFEPDADGRPNRIQVCYKLPEADPVADAGAKTINWDQLGRPENTTFGLGYAAGAYAANKGLPIGYTAFRTRHWAFFGTQLRDRDVFGGNLKLFDYETDALDFTTDPTTRLPVPTGRDQSPTQFQILGIADLRAYAGQPGYAMMGTWSHPSGGTVFNGGTTEWSAGLAGCAAARPLCTPIARITRNVLDHFNPITVMLYSARNGDTPDTTRYWVDTSQPPEGWDVVGAAFNAYTAAIDRELVPVYRFHAAPAGWKQLLSLDRTGPVKEGWTYDAVAFFAYPGPGEGRVPVRRIQYESPQYGYLERYTTSPLLRPGEIDRGTLFWVPSGPQAAPVYSHVASNRDSAGTQRYWLADSPMQKRWTPDGVAFNALRSQVDTEAVPVRGYHVAGEFGFKMVLRVGANPPPGPEWLADGVAFHAYDVERPGRVPVYRITYDSGTVGALERYSVSPDVRPGETNAGVAFFTLP